MLSSAQINAYLLFKLLTVFATITSMISIVITSGICLAA